jgi:hypothetical protein
VKSRVLWNHRQKSRTYHSLMQVLNNRQAHLSWQKLSLNRNSHKNWHLIILGLRHCSHHYIINNSLFKTKREKAQWAVTRTLPQMRVAGYSICSRMKVRSLYLKIKRLNLIIYQDRHYRKINSHLIKVYLQV